MNLDGPLINLDYMQDMLDPLFELLSEKMSLWLDQSDCTELFMKAFVEDDLYLMQHLRVCTKTAPTSPLTFLRDSLAIVAKHSSFYSG